MDLYRFAVLHEYCTIKQKGKLYTHLWIRISWVRMHAVTRPISFVWGVYNGC